MGAADLHAGIPPARAGMTMSEVVAIVVNDESVPFSYGVAAVAGLEVDVRGNDLDGGVRLDLTVRNPGRHAVALDEVVLRVRARPELVLEHGHQSWSVVRRCRPSDVRPDRAGLPRWTRGCHFSRPEAAGVVVAGDQFLVTSEGVAGFLDARRHLGTVEADADGLSVRALFDGVILEPNAERAVEPVWLADGDPGIRYSDFASLWGSTGQGRISAPAPIGWSSWYQYFAGLTPAHVRSNLAFAADRHLDLVQIDDGYQAAVGDWLAAGDGWAGGTAGLASDIRHAGLRAGLWTAPFLAGENSVLLRDHPDWAAREPSGGPARAAHNPSSWGGWAIALDTTRPEVLDHLRSTYAQLVDQGFDYHKIDYCYAAALPTRRHRPEMTRAEALRSGLEAVREGLGDEVFLLGCGCPFGPAVGVVDAMRVSPDVAPVWSPDDHWPGLAEAAPAAVNAVAASVLRAPLHRRVFINDPDCLLLRPADTKLEAWQRSFLAAVITGTGSFTVVSDDLGLYTEAEWSLLEALRSVHADVDTLLDIEDPFADPLVVRSAIGTQLTVDWRDDAPGGPIAQLGICELSPPGGEGP